jgi:hypothetical protein
MSGPLNQQHMKSLQAAIAAKEYVEAGRRMMLKQHHRLWAGETGGEPPYTGEVAPVVTNLAFGSELYAKALFYFRHPDGSIGGHTIRKLMGDLDENDRNEIEAVYDHVLSSASTLELIDSQGVKREFPESLRITFEGPNRPASVLAKKRGEPVDPMSLDDALQDISNGKSAFKAFRYSWENWGQESRELVFHLLHVNLLIKVLHDWYYTITEFSGADLPYQRNGEVDVRVHDPTETFSVLFG